MKRLRTWKSVKKTIKLKARRAAFGNLNSNFEEHRYYQSSVLLSKAKQGNNEMAVTDHNVVDEVNFSLRKFNVPMTLFPKKVF